jgi:Domain of unknown function (DUF1902)
MHRLIVVKATFDAESKVWFTESVDLPGLRIEGVTIDEIREKLPGAVLDLLEDQDDGGLSGVEVPIELIAHSSHRVRLGEAA